MATYEYKFDTTVQRLKYKVLRSLIKKRYHGGLDESIYVDIPKEISPGPKANLRCCIYKERAILQERIQVALGEGQYKDNKNILQVVDIACDECPAEGVHITDSCRGCISHKCVENCPKKALSIVGHKSTVDKTKCIECGKCVQVCPYDAIVIRRRPCQKACKVGAISMDENFKAKIDEEKCIECGACLAQCPFGAIQDKSFIMQIVDLLQVLKEQRKGKVYAILAPAIASQIDYATMGQIVTALKIIGFDDVMEAAIGADVCLHNESEEWLEKGTMTTSCCPAFVAYIEKNFPILKKYVSSSFSPMIETGKIIKAKEPNAKVIFIGPCSAKKMEFQLEKTGGAVDYVMSFEEMLAYIDALEIDMSSLEESKLDDATYFGRIFARSGGIKDGLIALSKTQEMEGFSPVSMNGIDECKKELTMLKLNRSIYNFFEGMACDGGCIGGSLNLHRDPKGAKMLETFNKTASRKTIQEISDNVKLYEEAHKNDTKE